MSYLNFQDIVAPKTLVVHLVIGIICVAPTLIFDESEPDGRVSPSAFYKVETAPSLSNLQSACSASWSRNVASHKASVAKGLLERWSAEVMRRLQVAGQS